MELLTSIKRFKSPVLPQNHVYIQKCIIGFHTLVQSHKKHLHKHFFYQELTSNTFENLVHHFFFRKAQGTQQAWLYKRHLVLTSHSSKCSTYVVILGESMNEVSIIQNLWLKTRLWYTDYEAELIEDANENIAKEFFVFSVSSTNSFVLETNVSDLIQFIDQLFIISGV